MNGLIRIFAVAIVLGLASGSLAEEKKAGEPADGGIKTESISLPAPAEGFQWVKFRDIDQPGIKAQVYLATKEGSQAKVVFVSGLPLPAEDKERANMVFGFFDGIVESMKTQGYTGVNTPRPTLRPPMPTRVAFSVPAKNASGGSLVTCAIIVFGKKGVYQFQAEAGTEAEAKSLLKCVDKLKELP